MMLPGFWRVECLARLSHGDRVEPSTMDNLASGLNTTPVDLRGISGLTDRFACSADVSAHLEAGS